jgi:TrmH family RNA methyltransferase
VTTPDVLVIASSENPQFKALRRLAQDNTAYKKAGHIWIEGDHLCRAALARGVKPTLAVFSSSFWPRAPKEWSDSAAKTLVLNDALWRAFSALESPAQMGFVIDLPAAAPIAPKQATVILDRVQDAGNVGSILRSASAFGFGQVLALKGTAALWSPKVLRAGMGAHFGLSLIEGAELSDLDVLELPLLVTSSHQGEYLHRATLPMPCTWALGHEGQGVCAELNQRASQSIRIAQPGGEESLNVAAAAAICLHACACLAL